MDINPREFLSYHKDSGLFFWKKKPSVHACARIGEIAGCKNSQGYVVVSIRGKKFRGHKLAWLFEHGEEPSTIDHINGNRMDNRITNLRSCTTQQNNWNMKKTRGKSKFKGVHFMKSGNRVKRWHSQISLDGKKRSLGYFQTEEEAAAAYDRAAEKLFGEFAKPNFGGS